MDISQATFEGYDIRRVYDEATETWYFSVIDIIRALLQQPDFQAARNYWKVLKNRLTREGSETVTKCNRLKLTAEDGKLRLTDYWKEHKISKESEFAILADIIHREWTGLKVQDHKTLKGLKNQNLRDHMSEAELIFTALAELSTRQIAETMHATGMTENRTAGKKGGSIARKARLDLEEKTGKSVVTGDNFLPPPKGKLTRE